MSVLDGTDIIYVSRVPVRRIMTVSITLGTRFPAYATSMGRVMLAGLDPTTLDTLLTRTPPTQLTARALPPSAIRDEIEAARQRGWSLVDQELEPGLRSLAAPVTDATGEVVAAINISTQSAQHSVEDIRREFLPHLIDTARAISADLAATTQ